MAKSHRKILFVVTILICSGICGLSRAGSKDDEAYGERMNRYIRENRMDKVEQLVDKIPHMDREKGLAQIAPILSAANENGIPKKIYEKYIEEISQMVSRADDDMIYDLSRYVLYLPPFRRDVNLLFKAQERSIGSNWGLRALNRYVITSNDLSGPEFDTLRAACQISDDNERAEFVATARPLLVPGNYDKLNQFLEKNQKFKLEAAYEMVISIIGAGKVGRVSLVRRKSDGRLFAWKVPSTDNPRLLKSIEDEVKEAQSWRQAGQSEVEAFFAKDGKSIFKTFVDGPTLRQALEDGTLQKYPGMREALIQWIIRGANSSIYNGGINAENLMFNRQTATWEIIDGDGTEMSKSPDETFSKIVKMAKSKWSRDRLAVHEVFIHEMLNDAKVRYQKQSLTSSSVSPCGIVVKKMLIAK